MSWNWYKIPSDLTGGRDLGGWSVEGFTRTVTLSFSSWALQATMWLPPIPAEFPVGSLLLLASSSLAVSWDPSPRWRSLLWTSQMSVDPMQWQGFMLHTNEQVKEKVIQKKVQYFQSYDVIANILPIFPASRIQIFWGNQVWSEGWSPTVHYFSEFWDNVISF